MNNPKKRAQTKECPVCGHQAWPIMYGMVMPNARAEYSNTEFAGGCIDYEQRVYPATTGKVEMGILQGACQNRECPDRWW